MRLEIARTRPGSSGTTQWQSSSMSWPNMVHGAKISLLDLIATACETQEAHVNTWTAIHRADQLIVRTTSATAKTATVQSMDTVQTIAILTVVVQVSAEILNGNAARSVSLTQVGLAHGSHAVAGEVTPNASTANAFATMATVQSLVRASGKSCQRGLWTLIFALKIQGVLARTWIAIPTVALRSVWMGNVCVLGASALSVAPVSIAAGLILPGLVPIYPATQTVARLTVSMVPASAKRVLAPISSLSTVHTNAKKTPWELAASFPAPPGMVLQIALTASACVWTINALKQENVSLFQVPLRFQQRRRDSRMHV